MQIYKIRKIGIKKAISNSNSYSSKRKKIWQFIDEQFDTIVYCIVDTIYTVIEGINFVVFEAAC